MKTIKIKDISNFKELTISQTSEGFSVQVVYSLLDDKDKELPNTQKRSSVILTEQNQKDKVADILNLLKPIFKTKEEL